MTRAIWKGAITFGLVNAPVALYPASAEHDIDFDWLDKRTMDPVGYKRINKRTGKEIDPNDIVRGIKQDNDEYVVLSDEEIREAYPKRTQSIEIETFVAAQQVPFVYLEKPYYLEPVGKGADRVYVLLREAMLEQGVIGVARVVMHTKQHLAALIATERALMLNTFRWASEIRDMGYLHIPDAGRKAIPLKETELDMAGRLIKDMTGPWQPEDYKNGFAGSIHELAARKLKAGKTEKVEPLEEAVRGLSESNVIDLSELLRNSLGKRRSAGADAASSAKKTAKRGAPAKRATRKRT